MKPLFCTSIYLTEMLLVLTWLDQGEEKCFSLGRPYSLHSAIWSIFRTDLPSPVRTGRNRAGERRMEGRKLRHSWVSSNAFSPPMNSFQPTLEGRCVPNSQKRKWLAHLPVGSGNLTQAGDSKVSFYDMQLPPQRAMAWSTLVLQVVSMRTESISDFITVKRHSLNCVQPYEVHKRLPHSESHGLLTTLQGRLITTPFYRGENWGSAEWSGFSQGLKANGEAGVTLLSPCLLSHGIPEVPPSGFPGGSLVKNLPADAGDAGDSGLIPGLGRSPGEGSGNPF